MSAAIVTSEPILSQATEDRAFADLDSYQALAAKQQPTWLDSAALEAAKSELSAQPPLVFAGEVDQLRERLAQAARGEAFLLQGGDCAETFAGATQTRFVTGSRRSCRWPSCSRTAPPCP